jgi:hypothetical protein
VLSTELLKQRLGELIGELSYEQLLLLASDETRGMRGMLLDYCFKEGEEPAKGA